MAIVQHVLIHTPTHGYPTINGVTAMLLAIDDLVDTTVALIRARGVTVLNAAGQAFPAGYFDSSRAVTTYGTAGEYSAYGVTQLEAVT